MLDPQRRHLRCARQRIVCQRRRARLPGGVERHLLIQRGADALGDAARHLAVHDHRVHQRAAVLAYGIIQDADLAGLRVHRHRAGVRGIAEGAAVAQRLVARGQLQSAGIGVVRQILRAQVPGPGDLGDPHAAVGAAHLAAAHHDLGRVHLQQVRADAGNALRKLRAGRGHGAARHHHAARSPGPGRVGRQRRVAMNHAHPRHRDAQHLMRDLRQRRLQPLAVRLHAHAQLQPAIGGDARRRLLPARHHRDAPARIDRGAVRPLLAEYGQTDAGAKRSGLLRLPGAHPGQVDRRGGAAQRPRVVAAVEVLAGDVIERHGLGRDQVPQAHRVRLHPALRRDGVHDGFHRVGHAGPRHATVGQDRRLVGGDGPGGAAEGREVVRAGQDAGDLCRLQAGRERVDRIGPGIHRRFAIQGQQAARPVGVGRKLVVVLAAVGVAGQALPPVLDPADGVAEAPGQVAGHDLLRQQDALVAEAAAHVGRDDAHGLLR